MRQHTWRGMGMMSAGPCMSFGFVRVRTTSWPVMQSCGSSSSSSSSNRSINNCVRGQTRSCLDHVVGWDYCGQSTPVSGQHTPQHRPRAEHCVSHARSSPSMHTVSLTAAGSDQRGGRVCRDGRIQLHPCRLMASGQSTVLCLLINVAAAVGACAAR
jgi:hypothetical protein